MAKSTHYYIRKSHRFLGVFLGIQFFIWTLGGLYFTWSNMDEIHGDFQKKAAPLLSSHLNLVSPSIAIENINKTHKVDSLITIQLVEILGQPFYQVKCMSTMVMNHLVDAQTGKVRDALSQEESIQVAARRFNGKPEIANIEYLTKVNGHNEYRENPLPAYAITFKDDLHTTVYVSTELGTVQKYRNSKWRIFDFLWMMHTMDYQSRDKIGNMLLRGFSILGMITIASGFALFFVSAKWGKRL
jgi:hypothetical protein